MSYRYVMKPTTFTLDLEDHLGLYAPDGRWVANSQRILDFCAEKGIKGTFFTVCRAAVAPALLRRIVAEGHELALHSYDHISLDHEDAGAYTPKLWAAKKNFEDMTGAAVKGFRAPQFSLTPKSHWVIDVLGELGFTYSSSIIAGAGMFHGYPGKPVTPFRWENGVWEFPVPVLRMMGAAVPFLGGVYLKFLPLFLVRALQRNMPQGAVLWTYTHPYDIDGNEGFTRLADGTPLWANLLLMTGRKNFLQKIGRLMDGQAAPRLIDRVPV